MYDVSQTWDDLIADPNHYFQVRSTINGVNYSQDQIFEISVEQRLFSEEQPSVGGCIAGELTIKLLAPTVYIPRMATVSPFVRVTDGTTYSEWIRQGIYYIDTREVTHNGDGLDVMTIHAFDAMLKTEADFPNTSHSWPAMPSRVARDIANAIGPVGIGAETWDLLTSLESLPTAQQAGYRIGLPSGYSMREVLSGIGAMLAGNWIFDYDGRLKLIQINSIPPETNHLVDSTGDEITFGGDMILV